MQQKIYFFFIKTPRTTITTYPRIKSDMYNKATIKRKIYANIKIMTNHFKTQNNFIVSVSRQNNHLNYHKVPIRKKCNKIKKN